MKHEWLKAIIGENYTEELDKKVSEEIGKHFVAKTDFDSTNETKKTLEQQIKDRDKDIADLKKAAGDNEDLSKKYQDLQTKYDDANKAMVDITKSYALKEQLAKSGVIDAEYLIYKLGGIEKFAFDKDNKPIGVEDAIKPYKEDKTMAHLFKVDKPSYKPNAGDPDDKTNPFAKETFNLTKQGELFKTDPARARELAAAAGVVL